MKKNDFLRQVIDYGYPRHDWEKDNFSIRDEYRPLLKEILAELGTSTSQNEQSAPTITNKEN